VCKLQQRKENRVFECVWLRSFLYWHSRISLYLIIAWFEKHCSKVIFSSLLWEVSEACPSLGGLGRWSCSLSWEDKVRVSKWRWTCVSYFIIVSVTLQRFCPVSELCENPTRVGCGFFTSVGLEVFHVKILCSLCLLIFTFCLVKNSQSKQTCWLFAKIWQLVKGHNSLPLLCLVLLKLNKWYQSRFSFKG